MNIFELPLDGSIDYGMDRKLNVRLRKDENDNLKLELLNNLEGLLGFGKNTLKCQFSGLAYNYNITFLNCSKVAGGSSPEIDFNSYITYTNFENTEDLTYVDAETLRNNICFKISNLDKWLYSSFEIGETKQISFVDENNIELKCKQDAKYMRIRILNKSTSIKFKYMNENFDLSIIDEFDGHSAKYPKIEIYPYCYLKLNGENPHNIMFYKKLINKIKKLFSLFYNQIAYVTQIYEFEKYKYRVDYYIVSEHEEEYFSSGLNIFYSFVKDKLGDIIQKWLDVYDEYELIINSICNFEQPKALSDDISKKAQLLETYGNIITKGQNTREDIKSALSDLSKENYKKIFHINKEEQDWITYKLDVRDFSSEYEQQISKLSEQIMNLRNHSTHPYKNGKWKSPSESNICEPFVYKNGKLNYQSIDTLCRCLNEVLIILLLQKLEIDDCYKQF